MCFAFSGMLSEINNEKMLVTFGKGIILDTTEGKH